MVLCTPPRVFEDKNTSGRIGLRHMGEEPCGEEEIKKLKKFKNPAEVYISHERS